MDPAYNDGIRPAVEDVCGVSVIHVDLIYEGDMQGAETSFCSGENECSPGEPTF